MNTTPSVEAWRTLDAAPIAYSKRSVAMCTAAACKGVVSVGRWMTAVCCSGDEPKAEFCSFMRLNSEPLVVQDVFGATSGDICVCKENPKAATTNGIVNGCRGTIKRDCCDQYNGDKNCRCVGDT